MDQFCKASIKFISFALTPNEPHKDPEKPRLVSFNTMASNETKLEDSQTWRVCSEEAFPNGGKSFKKVVFSRWLILFKASSITH